MNDETMHTFASVWDALEDDREAATNMRLRSELMIAIGKVVETWRTTRPKAAARLGVTPFALAALLQGDIDEFTLDGLVAVAARAGLSVEMKLVGAAA